MFRISRHFDFCYGHRLLNYDGKCRFLHGHNGRVVISLESTELDDRGMLIDFSDVKRIVGKWLDDTLDHRMILHRADPAAEMLQKLGEPLFLIDQNPTAENIARLIFDFTRNAGFPIIEAQLWETPNCSATYRP